MKIGRLLRMKRIRRIGLEGCSQCDAAPTGRVRTRKVQQLSMGSCVSKSFRVPCSSVVGLCCLLLLPAASGCRVDQPTMVAEPPPAPCHTSVAVGSPSSMLRVGDSLAFTASVIIDWCTPPTTQTVRWSVADSAIATVDAIRGVVIGRQPGTTTVRATHTVLTGLIGAASVTVRAR